MTTQHLSTYPQVRRLFPSPAESVSLLDAYDVPRPQPVGRPWMACAWSRRSTDQRSSVAWRKGNFAAALGSTDQQLLLTLRSLADVILVGASTVRPRGLWPAATAESESRCRRARRSSTSTARCGVRAGDVAASRGCRRRSGAFDSGVAATSIYAAADRAA